MLEIRPGDVGKFKWDRYMKRPRVVIAVQIHEPFKVKTEEGWFTAKAGDFLISGIKGELYACDQEIFHESYDWINGGEMSHSGVKFTGGSYASN